MKFPTVFTAAQTEVLAGLHERDREERRGGTVDAMPGKTAFAAENLEAAGLLHRLTLATSNGIDFVASLPKAIDFVLVDYGIPEFAPAFAGLRDRTAPGCFIFVDGGPEGYLESDAVRGFRALLEGDPRFSSRSCPCTRIT